jgi:hypothetical protein
MALWGKTHDSVSNKPKFLPNDNNSKYDITNAYATNSGWVMKAGAATGNARTTAQPEVLVAIRGLAGTSATTGLKLPTMTKFRVLKKADHGTSGNIEFEINYDEQVEVKSSGTAATIQLNGGAGGNVNATLISLDGTAFAAGVKGSTLLFRATSAQATTYTLADDVTMADPDMKDAVSGQDLDTAGIRLTAATKTAIGVTTIVIA